MQYYAVIDTNVLVSALLKPESVPGKIVNEVLIGKITPLLADPIMKEYEEVMNRDKFSFNHKAVDLLLEGIFSRGIFVDAGPVEDFIPDPKDVVFYAVTMEGKKENDETYLVTGNLKHFPERTFVVTPKEMLDILNKE